jgi:hypothetical protein
MRDQDWGDPPRAALGLLLRGAAPGCEPGDDDFILLANADVVPVAFVLPPTHWRVLADTQLSGGVARLAAGETAGEDAARGASAASAIRDGKLEGEGEGNAPLLSLSVGPGALVLLASRRSSAA